MGRLEAIRATLPEAATGVTVHHPSLKIRDRAFVLAAGDDAAPTLWIKTTRTTQQELMAGDPARFFSPPYLGPRGWVGMRIDGTVDWDEVHELVTDAYRLSAPKRLARLLDED